MIPQRPTYKQLTAWNGIFGIEKGFLAWFSYSHGMGIDWQRVGLGIGAGIVSSGRSLFLGWTGSQLLHKLTFIWQTVKYSITLTLIFVFILHTFSIAKYVTIWEWIHRRSELLWSPIFVIIKVWVNLFILINLVILFNSSFSLIFVPWMLRL